MKEIIKLFSIITGIFRSVVTILFLLAIVFTALVDVNLLVAFVDMLGFTGISAAVIKPILFIIFALMFVINFIITRHIFKSGYTGRYHLSNLVFALLFLAIDGFFYVSMRSIDNTFTYVLFALNGLIALNSILGLIGRARGLYVEANPIVEEEEKSDFIEFETDEDDEPIEYIEVSEAVNEDDKVIKETKISPTGAVESKVIKEEPSEPADSNTSSPDRIELGKNQKFVFESKSKTRPAAEQNSDEAANPINETQSTSKTVKRVARKKDSKNHTQPIHVVDATNKVERRDTISSDETYESNASNDQRQE